MFVQNQIFTLIMEEQHLDATIHNKKCFLIYIEMFLKFHTVYIRVNCTNSDDTL